MTVIDPAVLSAIRPRVFGERVALVDADRIEIEIEPGRVQSFPVSESLAAGIAALMSDMRAARVTAVIDGNESGAPLFDAIRSTGWESLGFAELCEIDGRAALSIPVRF